LSITPAQQRRNEKLVAYWLLTCCALIFAMVVLGGVTRLTGSGLSMVEWKPVYGILPPIGEEQWQAVFEKYQQSPEFKKINHRMDLAEFQGIFWLEYFHRVLGRIIGMVFLLPLLVFLATRRIPPRLTGKLATMFVLGGLQGLLGWYMVKSGLVDNPHVSQYRLAAHLMFAVLIYGYILWTAVELLYRKPEQSGWTISHRPNHLPGSTYAVLGLIAFTMTSGAFVAGLKAGFAYNTFPLMDGKWLPDGLLIQQPWFRNLFENVMTVQFDHRVLALLTLLAVFLLWRTSKLTAITLRVRRGFNLLMLFTLAQVGLGIATLLQRVPVPLASAHQATALLLFSTAVFLAQQLHAPHTRHPVPV